MAIFNQSIYENMTNVTQILDVVDVFTGGLFGIGIWILLSFGTFFVLSRYDIRSGLIASTFVAFVMSLFLAYLGMLDGSFVMISIGLFAVAVVLSLVIKQNIGGT